MCVQLFHLTNNEMHFFYLYFFFATKDPALWDACLRAHPASATHFEAILTMITGDPAALEANTASRWDLAAATAAHMLPELQASDLPALIRDVMAKRPLADEKNSEVRAFSLYNPFYLFYGSIKRYP